MPKRIFRFKMLTVAPDKKILCRKYFNIRLLYISKLDNIVIISNLTEELVAEINLGRAVYVYVHILKRLTNVLF